MPCPSCSATLQVEGCDADMQELRPFYQRLRICGEPGQQQLRSRCAMGIPGHTSVPRHRVRRHAVSHCRPPALPIPDGGRPNVCAGLMPRCRCPPLTNSQRALPLLAPPHPPAETHAKAHSITDASGHVMRFCQQCSKLQPIRMFEGSHRSCAASLDKREPGTAVLLD